jgi:HlyD family secretion protein
MLGLLLVTGCGPEPPVMAGSLEWELVRLTAPAAERITALHVAEGEAVQAGQELATLDARAAAAALAGAEAEAQRAGLLLEELRRGPREQRIAAARARVARAATTAAEAERQHARVADVAGRGLLPRADLDHARAARDRAVAELQVARAELRELEAGTRGEQLAQAEAALAAARAAVAARATAHGELVLRAPRAGVVESLPFEVGDRPPQGATIATLRVGGAPYLRLYVPQPLRTQVAPGTPLRVQVDGVAGPLAGRVRAIASEPSFTPYFALTGDDATRLVYLAEVALGTEAATLPAGLPAHAYVTDADAGPDGD